MCRAWYDENNTWFQPEPGTALFSQNIDESGHGTHVTGIVAAAGNNSVGMSGVNWRVSRGGWLTRAHFVGGSIGRLGSIHY